MGIAECTEGSGVSGVMTEEVAGIVEKVSTMEAILVKGGVFVGPGVGKTGLRVIIKRLGRWRGVKSLKRGFLEMSREISFKESDFFSTGDQTTIVDTEVGRIGVGICHDLRFPELAALYRKKGVHIICNPGAFNMSTATCSPSRDSTGSYTIWGHSTLVEPSSEIIATAGHEETISLQLDEQKREDIYKLIDVHELSP
ncbi:hypothetical protein ACFX2F_046436 [Malus domestica]